MVRRKNNFLKYFFITGFIIILCTGLGFGVLAYMTPPPPKPPVILPPPTVGAVSAVLMDGNTGDIIAQKEGDLKVYPASTTKILTCIIALEEGKDKLESNAIITPRATGQDGTNIGLRSDMPISLHELLYGMMLVSGNDAAVAVAETVGGSYDQFIQMMNEKASFIGASRTHFANPNGLTDLNHYTTAIDMAKISRYAMKNPEFRNIVKEKVYPMKYRNGIFRNVENRNEFLSGGYDGANGIKTGMTEAAGECLVASVERDGQLLIAAVYDDENRWKDVEAWFDYGFACIQAWEKYEQEMAGEPAVYKFMNQLMGKEISWEDERKRHY